MAFAAGAGRKRADSVFSTDSADDDDVPSAPAASGLGALFAAAAASEGDDNPFASGRSARATAAASRALAGSVGSTGIPSPFPSTGSSATTATLGDPRAASVGSAASALSTRAVASVEPAAADVRQIRAALGDLATLELGFQALQSEVESSGLGQEQKTSLAADIARFITNIEQTRTFVEAAGLTQPKLTQAQAVISRIGELLVAASRRFQGYNAALPLAVPAAVAAVPAGGAPLSDRRKESIRKAWYAYQAAPAGSDEATEASAAFSKAIIVFSSPDSDGYALFTAWGNNGRSLQNNGDANFTHLQEVFTAFESTARAAEAPVARNVRTAAAPTPVPTPPAAVTAAPRPGTRPAAPSPAALADGAAALRSAAGPRPVPVVRGAGAPSTDDVLRAGLAARRIAMNPTRGRDASTSPAPTLVTPPLAASAARVPASSMAASTVAAAVAVAGSAPVAAAAPITAPASRVPAPPSMVASTVAAAVAVAGSAPSSVPVVAAPSMVASTAAAPPTLPVPAPKTPADVTASSTGSAGMAEITARAAARRAAAGLPSVASLSSAPVASVSAPPVAVGRATAIAAPTATSTPLVSAGQSAPPLTVSSAASAPAPVVSVATPPRVPTAAPAATTIGVAGKTAVAGTTSTAKPVDMDTLKKNLAENGNEKIFTVPANPNPMTGALEGIQIKGATGLPIDGVKFDVTPASSPKGFSVVAHDEKGALSDANANLAGEVAEALVKAAIAAGGKDKVLDITGDPDKFAFAMIYIAAVKNDLSIAIKTDAELTKTLDSLQYVKDVAVLDKLLAQTVFKGTDAAANRASFEAAVVARKAELAAAAKAAPGVGLAAAGGATPASAATPLAPLTDPTKEAVRKAWNEYVDAQGSAAKSLAERSFNSAVMRLAGHSDPKARALYEAWNQNGRRLDSNTRPLLRSACKEFVDEARAQDAASAAAALAAVPANPMQPSVATTSTAAPTAPAAAAPSMPTPTAPPGTGHEAMLAQIRGHQHFGRANLSAAPASPVATASSGSLGTGVRRTPTAPPAGAFGSSATRSARKAAAPTAPTAPASGASATPLASAAMSSSSNPTAYRTMVRDASSSRGSAGDTGASSSVNPVGT